jgi:hypothetical protein
MFEPPDQSAVAVVNVKAVPFFFSPEELAVQVVPLFVSVARPYEPDVASVPEASAAVGVTV